MKNKYVCIHGHFYQPPRENPWIEEVEIEDSARPNHDWNERILHECYGPNAASPVLGSDGRIAEVVDNYSLMSFNFGPTLLAWLERRHPDVLRALVEADRKSAAARGGHGNALAQAYNHLIMPLATLRDKRTQVRWGLEDFSRRFHREAEGMWLPETAVDEESLEVLVEAGLKFTVLAPHQAARVRTLGEGEDGWKEVTAESLDATRPYRWLSRRQPGRHLDLFFYDHPLAKAVSFEKLLSSGEAFAKRIYGSFRVDDSVQLVHLATDGENYGHHHKFGNMALAYALKRLPEDSGAALVNYGQYLELHPPPQEVEIRRDTAWSCAHGLGRWKEDCGCRTGKPEWHQKWRGPLREALDGLAAGLDSFYAERSKGLWRDPWGARDAYIRRLLDPSPEGTLAFLDRHSCGPLDAPEASAALRLCEMQRQRLLMFTSCGWFFDDVSGIESVQILKYACRALELASSLGHPESSRLASEFHEGLGNAPSNVTAFKDASQVFDRLVAPLRVDLARAAAHFALQDHLGDAAGPREQYVFDLRLERLASLERQDDAQSRRLSAASIHLRHRRTMEELRAVAVVHHRGRVDLECRVLPFAAGAGNAHDISATLSRAFQEGSEESFLKVLSGLFPPGHVTLDALLPDHRRQALSLLIPRGNPQRESLLQDWAREARRLQEDPDLDEGEALRLAEAASSFGIPPDSLPDAEALRGRAALRMKRFLAQPGPQPLEALLSFLRRSERAGVHLHVWELQKLFASSRAALGGRPDLREGLRALSQMLNFAEPSEEGVRHGNEKAAA